MHRKYLFKYNASHHIIISRPYPDIISSYPDHIPAASVFMPSAKQLPLQVAAHNGGHVIDYVGAIAHLAIPVVSCSRIRRGMRQDYETFLATCATYDTAHAYPSSMPCRPQPGRKCG
jgi:hypothetical protein